jgi:hypothetical protein
MRARITSGTLLQAGGGDPSVMLERPGAPMATGFKVVRDDYTPVVGTGGPHVFEVGSQHVLDDPHRQGPVLCLRGFHFSRTPLECLVTLPLQRDRSYRLLAVEADGGVLEGNYKLVTMSLRVTGELDWATHTTGRLSICGGLGWMTFRNGLLHQDDDDPEAAKRHPRLDGTGRWDELWYRNGELDRADDGPVTITFDHNGRALSARWPYRDAAAVLHIHSNPLVVRRSTADGDICCTRYDDASPEAGTYLAMLRSLDKPGTRT